MEDRASIAFVLSHACPLKCNFCCSTKEIVGSRRIRREMITSVMKKFGNDQRVERFAFTGGDPYLYIADIKAAVADARAAGVAQQFEINTSGYWARDAEQVRETLLELRALGLKLLRLSYDHEHAKWVSADQIMMLCRVASELSIRTLISATFWEVDQNLAEVLPDLETLGSFVTWDRSLVAPIGRARASRELYPQDRGISEQSKWSCRRPGYYSLSIYPDGEVYPCCSGGFHIEAGLSCGNVHRQSGEAILYAAFTNFHVRLVKEFGWQVLYKLVENEAPELLPRLPRFDTVDSVCEICRDLNLTMKDALAPVYGKVEVEYARARARFDWLDREKAEGRSSRRRVGEKTYSADEFLDRIVADRDLRLDYLAGVVQLGEPADRDRVLQPVHG